MNQSNLLTVRVAGVMNRQAVVLHVGRTLPCLLSGRLLRQKDSLAVGDRAEAEVLGGGQYRLTRVLPRTSALRRPSRRGSGDALLAANADFVLAVCAAPSLLRAFTLPEWALEAARAAGLPVLLQGFYLAFVLFGILGSRLLFSRSHLEGVLLLFQGKDILPTFLLQLALGTAQLALLWTRCRAMEKAGQEP